MSKRIDWKDSCREDMLRVHRIHLFDGVLTVYTEEESFSFRVNEKDISFNMKGEFFVLNTEEGVSIYDYNLNKKQTFTVPEYEVRM